MLISSPSSIFCPPYFALLVFVEIVWAQLIHWSSNQHYGVGNIVQYRTVHVLVFLLADASGSDNPQQTIID